MWYEVGVQLHSFAQRDAGVVEKTILSLLNCLGVLIENYTGLFITHITKILFYFIKNKHAWFNLNMGSKKANTKILKIPLCMLYGCKDYWEFLC